MLPQDIFGALFSEHDWLRALRMSSYGFLFYGPGSYAWYQFLERAMPKQTVENLLIKVFFSELFKTHIFLQLEILKFPLLQVLLNQIVLGPTVIAVVFAWNNLWQGRLSQLPKKYQKDALPSLIFGKILI